MADNEQKAMQLIAEAEKKLNSSKSFLGSLFGGGSRAEEAVELYARAGNLLKMSKKWGGAGGAFAAAAGVHLRGGAKHDAATSYVDAANCYKKVDAGEAVTCLLKAIEIYTDMGRFTVAAKQHQVIAELYEAELGDMARAMQHYEQAAEYFRGEESTAAANKCLLKMAQYAATLERYDAAINIYEQVATAALENSLLKYSAKEYLFRAALCHLCVDALNAQLALDKYVNMYPAFADSREYKLLKELIEQLEEGNAEGFTAAVAAYDSISRLDAWHTALLVRIKKQINDDPDLR